MPGSGQGWLLFFARDGFESSTAHRSHKKGWRMGRCRRGRCRRNADCRRRHEPAPEPHQNRRISRDGGSKALMSDEWRRGLETRFETHRGWWSWRGEGAAYALRPEASCGRLRYRLGRGGGEGGGALPGSGFATGHFLAAAAVPLCPATCCEHTPRPMKHCAPKVAWQPMGRGQGNKGGSYNTHLEPSPVAELRTRWGARGWMSWVSRLCLSA